MDGEGFAKLQNSSFVDGDGGRRWALNGVYERGLIIRSVSIGTQPVTELFM